MQTTKAREYNAKTASAIQSARIAEGAIFAAGIVVASIAAVHRCNPLLDMLRINPTFGQMSRAKASIAWAGIASWAAFYMLRK